MEVHDFDKEHLESVLTGDERPEQEAPTKLKVPPHYHSTAPRRSRSPQGQESNTSQERYSLLPDYAQASFVRQNGDTNTTENQEHQTSLSFQDLKTDVESNLPKDVKTAIWCLTPVTKRARDMVRMTAVKCVSAPQLEVMLKVKQADNPEFSFLKANNACHAYYLWLKQEEEKRRKEQDAVQNAGGMDLLGMYSSSSDDEVDDKKAQLKKSEDTQTNRPFTSDTSPAPTQDMPDNDRKRPVDDPTIENDGAAAKKTRRLKRAKQMRGHYRLQLMEGESKSGDRNS